ncbi:hypothetical protein ACQ86N_25625 [Puia sp. P3]|uniref:hypothetical protein n=1 Tax=Puia sp. P3 TaxID=3423952 RepID=UPI003D67DAD7
MLSFARDLNILSPVLVTAAFVPEVDYAQLWTGSGGVAMSVYVEPAEDEDAVIEVHSEKLKKYCAANGIRLRIHSDRFDFALPAIRKEARFADMLVISGVHFFDVINARQPNAYMKEILHGAECPVMLVPEQSYLPGDIILMYDGSDASVYAIKQFAYLFPKLASTRATLVHLLHRKDDPFPDRQLMEELTSQYFSNLRVMDQDMRPEAFFDTWIPAQDRPWLVCGSFGRSDMSRFFSGSFISGLIRKQRLPIFIAHR